MKEGVMNKTRKTILAVAIVGLLLLAILYSASTDQGGLGAVGDGQKDRGEKDRALVLEIEPIERSALEEPGVAGASGQDVGATQRTFEEIYAELVVLFRAKQGLHLSQARMLADEFNGKASLLFKELAPIDVAALRAAAELDTLPVPWKEFGLLPEVAVCELIVDFELQEMSVGGHKPERLTPLVGMLLERLVLSVDYCQFVAELLIGSSYLQASHEPALLDLARNAKGDLAYMRDPVAKMLATLWENTLGKDDEFLNELQVFLDGDDSVLAKAALQKLLLSKRYRDIAIERLIDKGDDDLMSEMATLAAGSLPAEQALSITAQLRSASKYGSFVGAYSKLAEADSSVLGASYKEALQDNTQLEHRCESIAALGNYAGEAGVGYARLAFDAEEEPRVRGVALLALAGKPDFGEFPQCFNLALESKLFHTKEMTGYLTSSLRNHAQIAEVGFLRTAINGVLALNELSEVNRTRLLELRSRYCN